MAPLDMFCSKEPEEWLGEIQHAQDSGKGISILDIAERVHDPHAAGTLIRPSTPRSVEAFLQSGIDPEDLVYKPLEYFKKRCNNSDELAGKAFTFFDGQRQKRIEELRARRQALIEENWKPGDLAKAGGKVVVEGTDDMVERERKRLEVLKKRQEQELQQLVDYELKRAEIQAIAEEKLAKQEARAKAQAEETERKEAAWRANLREQQLRRLAEEEEEERKVKEAEKIRFRKEQEFLASEKEREKQMRKEAYRKEQERIQKSENARAETEAILERQQREVEARKREMALRDQEREAVKVERQRILAQENEEKRVKAEARLKAAFDANIQILEKKRQDYYARERLNEERRNKQEQERIAADELKRLELEDKKEKRKGVYKMAVTKQKQKVSSILQKAAEQEEIMQKEKRRQDEVLAQKRLSRQLNMEYRMECVDTNRKQQLYHREQMLQKIQAETDRIMQMQRDRTRLQQQRKEANMQAAIARQKMVETMDKLQQAKKFDQIATGQITIDSLLH